MAQPVDSPRLGVGGALAAFLDRPTGGQRGDVGRAASVAQAFLLFSLIFTAAYTCFYALYDPLGLRPLIVVGIVSVLLFAAGIVAVRRGRQLTAAVIAVIVGAGQAAFVTTYIGWVAGYQLFLIAGGQLVFLLFTERQQLLRVGYVVLAIVTFFYCQLVVPERGFGFALPPDITGVLFSINATATLLLIFVLGAVSHYGAARARGAADEAAARAEYLANTDELTGLANRRPVMRRLAELSSSGPYVVAIADLDHFKRVNDTFGHECGDRVLAAVGERFRAGVREGDSVGRWGGEEFIVVMEHVSLADATVTMERLRQELAAPVPCTGHSHEVTMSVGITDAQPDGMAHRALQRADRALYAAKAAGRDTFRTVEGPAALSVQTPSPRRRRT